MPAILARIFEKVQEVYHHRRNAALAALRRHFPLGVQWNIPTGGLHIWVMLPGEVDVNKLYLAAIEQGVGFVPGALFFPEGVVDRHLRLSYGFEPPERIEAGIAKLGALVAQTLRVARAGRTPAS